MLLMSRCLVVPCGLPGSVWLRRSCRPSSPARPSLRPYSTTEPPPLGERLGVEQSEQILEQAPKKPAVAQSGPVPTNTVEGGTTQRPGATRLKKKQESTTWGPEMWADSPLCSRPGLTRFLDLREVKEPPGLTFDPATMTLSMTPSYQQKLHFRMPTHQKVRPWIEKACLQRAQAWLELDRFDYSRVEKPHRTINRTSKRHRGNTLAQHMLLYNASCSIQKHALEPFYVRWHKCLAPTLPERLYGHIDGIVPEDAGVYIEEHRSYVNGHSGRVVSSVWVAINASYSVSMRTCSDMATGKPPHPDWDILTPLLKKFTTWFQNTYHNQKGKEKELQKNDSQNPRLSLPVLRDMIPPGHDIPVVFAFRHKYLLFIWKDGIKGKLIAQYGGYWLPVNEVGGKTDLEKKINQSQLTSLRRGAAEDALPKTSGGKPALVGIDKYDPDWIEPEHFTVSLSRGQEGKVEVDKKRPDDRDAALMELLEDFLKTKKSE